MRKLIISLVTAAAIAATAGPAFAAPPDPCHAPAHVAAARATGHVLRQPCWDRGTHPGGLLP
jgi:predicted secreted protein